MFYGAGLGDLVQRASARSSGATVFCHWVSNPSRYGVLDLDASNEPIRIEEKPTRPTSNWAVTGLYFYDSSIVDIARELKPSARGELEITDANRIYLDAGRLKAEKLGRGFAWFDAGTHQSLLQASEFIYTIEERQGLKIGCPEEIAYRMGFIDAGELERLAGSITNSEYSDYLRRLVTIECLNQRSNESKIVCPLPHLRYAHRSFHVVRADADRKRFSDGGRGERRVFLRARSGVLRKLRHVSTVEQPQPDKMFHGQYAFYSSTSRFMQLHFESFANAVMKDVLAGRADPFVVELGSNDGIMLRHFHDRGIRHLGIEPSVNVADVARATASIRSVHFSVRHLPKTLSRNMARPTRFWRRMSMCHIADLRGIAAGVQRLLKPDGVLIFEDPYLGDMIAKTSYDQIYDEHVFIFSANSVKRAFDPYDLELARCHAADNARRIDALSACTEGKPPGRHLGFMPNLKKNGHRGCRRPRLTFASGRTAKLRVPV